MNDPILQALHNVRQKDAADKLSTKLQSIAKLVEKELRHFGNDTTGKPLFSLFVYADGAAQYVSNASRPDVKTILATVISRWDTTPELHVPMHEKTQEDFDQEKENPL